MMKRIASIPVLALIAGLISLQSASAQEFTRLAGVLGRTSDNKATLEVKEGNIRGTYTLVRDIKGLALYPGERIIALDPVISGETIDFQKFEWERLEDFMLAEADLLPTWELPARFAKREISGAALKKLPNNVPDNQTPARGIAQRMTLHLGDEYHNYQIRYYEFRSPSAAAMFAERWSAKKGVSRDTSEHFRRAFDKYGVWILNADDERQPPDYWTARFILESLSRKSLIALDTAAIFNKRNADVVVFNPSADTLAPGETLVLHGQGFSPFMRDNVVSSTGPNGVPFRLLSSTSHQLAVEVPRTLGIDGQVQEVQVQVMVRHYAATNPVSIYVRR